MGFFYRLWNTVRRSAADAGFDEEVRSHIEARTQDYVREGLTPEDAHVQALRRFGNAALIREQTRDVDRLQWVDTAVRDVRFGVRGLVKHPGFSTVALLVLAIGIGANTAMFSMLHGVLLRPLPYPDPDNLVSIARGELGEADNRAVSLPRLETLQNTAKSFTRVGAFFAGIEDVTLAGGGEPEVLRGARVSGNFLEILGTRPELGRSFRSDEDAPGGPAVALISAQLWRRRFGGDAGLLGTTVTLNATPYTIVGVLPESFQFPFPTLDVWFPRPSQMASLPPQFHACCAPLRMFARVRSGVTLEQARAELRILNDRWAADHPNAQQGLDAGAVHAVPLKDELTAPVNAMLWVLVAAVSFVLLIACANIAMLLMARATSRAREFAVRASIGATRGQLARQLLTESLVLGTGGGALGLLMAHVILGVIRQMTIFDLPRVHEINLDTVALGFAFALSLGAGVVFGTFPSLQMLRSGLVHLLRQGATSDAGSTRGTRTTGVTARATLVVVQVALSTVLLIGAGLLTKTLAHLASIDMGFRANGLLTMRVPLPPSSYDTPAKRARFFEELVERVDDIPGVDAVAAMRALPTTAGILNTNLQIDEQRIPPPGHSGIRVQTITSQYFDVLGIRLQRGRGLADADSRPGAARVVVINESFARRFWPAYPAGPDPVGKRIAVPIVGRGAIEIVGIVRDVREQGLTREAIPQFYLPNALYPPQNGYLAVRAAADPTSLIGPIRAAVRAIDGDQSVADIRMMSEILEASEGQRHLAMRLLTLFAGTALVLALVGIYGVVAYSVTRRTPEIGLRRALGATSAEIVPLVLGQVFWSAIIGVVCGVLGAVALSRLMQSLLFEVSTTDARVYASVAGTFVVITLVAGFVPAWRAIRISPMLALRSP